MPSIMAQDQRQRHYTYQTQQIAKWELVRQVEQGMTAWEARRRCPVPIHRTTVYRLLKRVEREGEQALVERRHGHPVKLRGEVLTWVMEYCQSHVSASGSEVQRLVAELLADHGECQPTQPRMCRSRAKPKGRAARKKSQTGLVIASGSNAQADSLLLLASATETGLLTQLEQALPPPPAPPEPLLLPLAGSPAVRQRLLLTLLAFFVKIAPKGLMESFSAPCLIRDKSC